MNTKTQTKTADASQNREQLTQGEETILVGGKLIKKRDWFRGKPELPEHSPLPWSALDWMILCDKVNKYGNFYVADISPQFLDKANPEALAEANANLKLIVASVNHAEALAEALREVVNTWERDFKGMQTGYENTPLEANYKQAKKALANWEKAKQ